MNDQKTTGLTTLGRLLINVDTTMASMYALFTFRLDLTPWLTPTLGFKSGHLIDIAFDVLNKRNVRDLELNDRSPAFRKLKSFFKKLHIKINSISRSQSAMPSGDGPSEGWSLTRVISPSQSVR